MSSYIDLDRGIKPTIEMPPLPEEPVEQISAPEPVQEVIQDQSEAPEELLHEELQESVKPSPQESFRQLKAKAERAERERDELLRRLQETERLKQQHQQPVEDEVHLNPDDLVEWKHVDSKIRKLENQLRAQQQQQALAAAEMRLKAQFPDIDQVVSAENVQKLSLLYPEFAEILNESGDLYKKAASAYKMIKNLGIMPNTQPVYKERELARANVVKPRPMASISPQQGDSPMSHANAFANGLTPDLQAQLLKEMRDAQKNM